MSDASDYDVVQPSIRITRKGVRREWRGVGPWVERSVVRREWRGVGPWVERSVDRQVAKVVVPWEG